MAIDVPGVGLVPIVWMPASDEDFRDASEGGRSGWQPIAFVYHRIVGSLNSADLTFAANDTNPATVGSAGRPVSSNFGIGYDTNGQLEAHQYVDISDTPYTNGDCRALTHPDEPSRWDGWHGHKAHNERSVTFELDDQGGSSDPTKKGIVREPIIATAIAITRLLRTGNLAAIRAAGIRIRDKATADALARITPKRETILDHNDIAGANKPYCWRPWQADKVGIPRARIIAELTAAPAPTPEDDMLPLIAPSILGFTATVKAGFYVRTAPKLTAGHRTTTAAEAWTCVGWVQGDIDPDGGTGRWLMRAIPGGYEFASEANLAAPPTDPTPISAAQRDAAVKAATDPLQARITGIKAKTAAFAADVAND